MRKTTTIRRKIKQVIDGIGRFDPDLVYDHYFENNVYPFVRIMIPDGIVLQELDNDEECRVRVEIFDSADQANEVIEDLVDEHAESVEDAIKANLTLDGEVDFLLKTDFDTSVDFENSIGMIGLNFKCKYEE